MAAAVQPSPEMRQKAARPESFTFSNMPSVTKHKALMAPLSSSSMSARYNMASWGAKESTPPTPPRRPSQKNDEKAALRICEDKNPAKRTQISSSTHPFKSAPGMEG